VERGEEVSLCLQPPTLRMYCQEVDHTLTFGSPSMSPDPGRKEKCNSVSCSLSLEGLQPLRRILFYPGFHQTPTLCLYREFSVWTSFSEELLM
jgi:hypothetical protein